MSAMGDIVRGIVAAFRPPRPPMQIDPRFEAQAASELNQARSRLLESTKAVRQTADRVISRVTGDNGQHAA